ncbi:MAG: SAM hydroxide adenosyltransferase [Opitutales bacterium]
MKASIFLILTCVFTLSLPAQTQLTGTIEGAKYSIAMPEEPIGKVLLLAHGYRPENLGLKADAGASHNLYTDLVEEGWIVASSSYRHNGWIMEDAAQDMINLHELVTAATHGDPGDVYLMGNSMGGGVSTLLAEIAGDRFKGALATGAYLFEPIQSETHRSTTIGSHFSLQPQIPVLYLTNTSELEGPETYISKTASAPIQPVLWKVHRDGHVNLNEAELRAGLMAVIEWAETGKIEKDKDATIILNPPSTAKFSGDSAEGTPVHLVEVYGNAISSFVRADMEKLGIQLGDTFQLTAEGQTVNVLLGSNYNDVPVGEWVSFWDADGYLLICRNYRNAVDSLGLNKDSKITISKK